jgi:hypothetical protein
MKDRYVVFWLGNNIHHFFATYEEAKKYLLNNNFSTGIIAYVVAQTHNEIAEYDCYEFCKDKPV